MPWAADSRRRAELPADWATIRRRILDRDSHTCRWTHQGQRCGQPATDVDHIRRGDDHSDGNLRALCADHHKRKTQAEAAAALREQRAKLRHPPERHPGLT